MANLDVGMKCIKYMIFVTNFMFVMIAFLLISIGSTVGALYSGFDIFMEDHFFSPSALLIAIGIIILFVSVFGCIGAIKESVCLVKLYGVLLAIILALEIAAAVAGYAMRNNLSDYLDKNMNRTMKDYYTDDYSRDSWDFLQYRFRCCGINSKDDWLIVKYPLYNDTTFLGPDTCCWTSECKITDTYQRGCLEGLRIFVSECAVLIGTGAVCVALVQFLGVIFANMLAKSIRQLKTEKEMKRQETRQRLYAELLRSNDQKPSPVIFATPTESDA